MQWSDRNESREGVIRDGVGVIQTGEGTIGTGQDF